MEEYDDSDVDRYGIWGEERGGVKRLHTARRGARRRAAVTSAMTREEEEWLGSYWSKVKGMSTYECSASTATREFAVMFSLENASNIYHAVYDACGMPPDVDDTFDMMIQKFAANPSHSYDINNASRDDESPRLVVNHVLMLTNDVISSLVFIVREALKLHAAYRERRSAPKIVPDQPEYVHKPKNDHGWEPRADFLMPDENDEV